jgi:glycosidase
VRLSHALVALLLLIVLGNGCQSSPSSPAIPARSCSVTVWYHPTSAADDVQVVTSWSGWSQPGTTMTTTDGDWRVAQFDGMASGPAEYVIVDDGETVLDPNVGTTAFHDGQEVSWVSVPDCSSPATQVDAVTPGATGSASIDATFLASASGDALDPSSITLATVHGAAPVKVTPSGDPTTGKIHLDLEGLPPGKATLAVQANDVKGRVAQAALATVWIEPQAWDWRDAIVYEVMVDRYRAADGSALAPPTSMGGRAGGNVAGVTHAITSGQLSALGVNTVWLTPLYANPDGQWLGLDGNEYTSYHGYWPSQPRATEASMAAAPDVDALVAAAHARGIRVLFDVVPHHTHTLHPYWAEHENGGWFQDTDGGCVCGIGTCSWATDETACWFTTYLPSLDWTNDDVATTVTSDVRWWMDRFDGDGVRIDAVPMMPRAAIRRIAWDIRSEYDGPSRRSMVLGENYTGQDDWPSLKFFLGPTGLDSEFHFPLMWALRGALASNDETLVDLDTTIRTGEQTWSGSGAVMGLILDNHDVSRFITVAAGDDDGVTWTPAPQPSAVTPYTLEQMAMGALFTLPGMPVLYYGDEIGLAGKSDPDSRRVMPPDSALSPLQTQTRSFVETLAKARICSEPLRRGTYRTLHVDPERLIYARETPDGQAAIVDLERNVTAPFSGSLPGISAGNWVDVLSGRVKSLSPELTMLPAAPFSVSLYVPTSSACSQGAGASP